MSKRESIRVEFLTETEKKKVVEVLRRSNSVRRRDTNRIRKLQERARGSSTKQKSSGGFFACPRCRRNFSLIFGRGVVCRLCSTKVCRQCTSVIERANINLCSLCYQDVLFEAKSGHWFMRVLQQRLEAVGRAEELKAVHGDAVYLFFRKLGKLLGASDEEIKLTPPTTISLHHVTNQRFVDSAPGSPSSGSDASILGRHTRRSRELPDRSRCTADSVDGVGRTEEDGSKVVITGGVPSGDEGNQKRPHLTKYDTLDEWEELANEMHQMRERGELDTVHEPDRSPIISKDDTYNKEVLDLVERLDMGDDTKATKSSRNSNEKRIPAVASGMVSTQRQPEYQIDRSTEDTTEDIIEGDEDDEHVFQERHQRILRKFSVDVVEVETHSYKENNNSLPGEHEVVVQRRVGPSLKMSRAPRWTTESEDRPALQRRTPFQNGNPLLTNKPELQRRSPFLGETDVLPERPVMRRQNAGISEAPIRAVHSTRSHAAPVHSLTVTKDTHDSRTPDREASPTDAVYIIHGNASTESDAMDEEEEEVDLTDFESTKAPVIVERLMPVERRSLYGSTSSLDEPTTRSSVQIEYSAGPSGTYSDCEEELSD